MDKPSEDRLLTREDEIFIAEITKRCVDAPYGTVHAEVQYTALHFQSKTASIYEARIARIWKEIEKLRQPIGKTGSHPNGETIVFGSSIEALKAKEVRDEGT